MKYFKKINSYEDLKNQFKKLLKENHPDNGGDAEIMKEINVEYDSLFPIWKDRHNKDVAPDQQTTETADSTRTQFYTDFGWEGKNHDWNRTLKEIAVIVRNYVKEKYPTYKFSVRTSYASMCQELHVSLKEAPKDIYKTIDELNEDEVNNIMSKAIYNHYTNLESWYQEEAKREIERMWNDRNTFMMIYCDDVDYMLKDVDSFVKSYNYSDCDGMQDYFNVDFYYFGCKPDDLKIVPKTARVTKKEETTAPATTEENKNDTFIGEEYEVKESVHTKTGAKIWLVKVLRTLSKDEYITVNKFMKSIGGYYSRFTHSFVFSSDPSEKLSGKVA